MNAPLNTAENVLIRGELRLESMAAALSQLALSELKIEAAEQTPERRRDSEHDESRREPFK